MTKPNDSVEKYQPTNLGIVMYHLYTMILIA